MNSKWYNLANNNKELIKWGKWWNLKIFYACIMRGHINRKNGVVRREIFIFLLLNIYEYATIDV